VALARETPLLTTIAEVVDITSVQDLANLEADAEFSAADTLAEAHRWVYDRLKHRLGSDALSSLSNQTELKRAVAFRFLETLSAAGYLSGGSGPEYWGTQAREEADGFRPEFSDTTDEARSAAEDVPAVGNFESGWVFGPSLGRRSGQKYWKGFMGGQS
jgi:hypothetical protein